MHRADENLLLEDLKRAIGSQRALVIVGAGVSIAASRTASASWLGLLRSGLVRCRALGLLDPAFAEMQECLLDSNDLDLILGTAGVVARKLGGANGPEFRIWLRETVGSLDVLHGEVLETIAALGVPIATTNYDGLLERATGYRAITWQDQAAATRLLRGEDTQSILHLHGYWERPETVILGPESYQRVVDDEFAQATLHALQFVKTLVFVGCGAGLSDPNFGRLIHWSGRVLELSEHRRFLLVSEPERAEHRERVQADPRLYLVTYGTRHDELPPFLRTLRPALSVEEPEQAQTHPLWNLEHARNPDFLGREDNLTQLHAALESSTGPAQLQLIRGLGGVGKTELAVEYAHRHADVYAGVWWLRASSPETLMADYSALARPLGVERVEQDEATVDLVRDVLRSRRRFLLIFDDLEDEQLLRRFLPHGHGARVIVTSRAARLKNAREHALDVLDEAAATAYLQRRTAQKDPDAALRIVRRLGAFPFALEQAAAYVCECRETLETYANWLEAFGPADVGLIEATWSRSFAALEDQPGSMALLYLCAFIASEPIDLLELRAASHTLAPGKLPPDLARALSDERTLSLAKRSLLAHSLAVAALANTAGRPLTVRCLVQEVARKRLGETQRRLWLSAALHLLNAAFPEDVGGCRTWPTCERLLSHVVAVIKRSCEIYGASWCVMPEGDSRALGRLLNQAGLYFRQRASYNRAELMYRQALLVGKATLGPDHALVATRAYNLGILHWWRGTTVEPCGSKAQRIHEARLLEAEELLEQALRINRAIAERGAAHRAEVARDLNGLALLACARGEFHDALEKHDRALELAIEALGERDPAVARILNNLSDALALLAAALESSGKRRKRALRKLPDVLKVLDVHPDEPSTERARNVLRVAALERSERALDIMASCNLAQDPWYARVLRSRARLQSQLGRRREALADFRAALEIYLDKLGTDHPHTVDCKSELARADTLEP